MPSRFAWAGYRACLVIPQRGTNNKEEEIQSSLRTSTNSVEMNDTACQAEELTRAAQSSLCPHVQEKRLPNDLPVIRRKSLKMGKMLGSGYFADVYRAKLALSRHEIVRVAVKVPVNDPKRLEWTA